MEFNLALAKDSIARQLGVLRRWRGLVRLNLVRDCPEVVKNLRYSHSTSIVYCGQLLWIYEKSGEQQYALLEPSTYVRLPLQSAESGRRLLKTNGSGGTFVGSFGTDTGKYLEEGDKMVFHALAYIQEWSLYKN
jgi:hypothetical protein